MKKLLIALPLLLASNHLIANDFEASLSSQTAQFSVYSDSSIIGWGGSDLALRFLYNETSDFLAQAEILSIRQASENTPLTLGVGAKAFVGKLDDLNKDVIAIALGGTARYVIPAKMPLTLYANLFFAPEITSFSGSKDLTDLNIGAQIEIMPQTNMFIGYRQITINTSDVTDYRVDDDRVHFGIRLTF